MKIKLVTLFDDAMAEIGLLTSSRMNEYSKIHGYEFVYYSSLLDPSLHPSWNKLLALKLIMQMDSPDWVLWIDADALILNLHYPATNIIDQRFDVLFASDFNGLCAGVVLIKNSSWSRQFLDCALFAGDMAYDPDGFGYKAEQNTFKQMVQTFPSISSRIALVEQRTMNSYLECHSNTDFILHLHSLPNSQRLNIIKTKLFELGKRSVLNDKH